MGEKLFQFFDKHHKNCLNLEEFVQGIEAVLRNGSEKSIECFFGDCLFSEPDRINKHDLAIIVSFI
jgi:hypothetical protein